jgi:hypothetical protein
MRVKLLASSLMLLSLVALTVSAQTLSIDRERNRGRLMLKEIKDDLKRNYYDPTFRGIAIILVPSARISRSLSISITS